MRKRLNNKGFALIGILLIILVLGVVGGAGVYVWHKNHKAKSSPSTTSTTTTKTDPYVGWKRYCDDAYRYCFRYPSTWSIDTTSEPNRVGESGQVTVLNPSKTLQVSYVNSYTQDSGVDNFNTVAVTKLTDANEDLSVVGGYYATSGVVGNFAPSYRIVDSSLLGAYPLAVGKASQFPINPRFTDKRASTYSGSFVAKPAVSINTASDRDAWLDGADTKTSLLILESLSYN